MDQSMQSKLIKIERCVYCASFIESEHFLQCQVCQGHVHIKCLQNSSTPGDLIGDIFFDLTCIQCVKKQRQIGEENSPQSVKREIIVRKKLPWVIVLVLVIYNLSIKSKGLSHNGYFHWQNHIGNFIEKNWKYLFATPPRRRKRWISTVAGALSQYSPDFFISGHEAFGRSGWWKITHSNRTPKYIYMLYEQHCQKRQQQRLEKRLPSEELQIFVERKKLRHSGDSEEDEMLMGTCSRAIPYMGRKPKVVKQLNNSEEENRTTVQSNLMDFLAETLSNDDLSMFNSLPGEPLMNNSGTKHEFIPFMDANEDNAHFFEMSEVKDEDNECSNLNNILDTISKEAITIPNMISKEAGIELQNLGNFDSDGDGNDDNEYQPRIIQVTNFQQELLTKFYNGNEFAAIENCVLKNVKNEILSDNEENVISNKNDRTTSIQNHNSVRSDVGEELIAPLPPCKNSLFSKKTKRLWPWLSRIEECIPVEETSCNEERCLVLMSAYEESELLAKLRKVFLLETKASFDIPPYIRRLYRKLCIRAWKRAHGKPLFDLDQYQEEQQRRALQEQKESRILDRYQLISLSTKDNKKSFYARISGAPQHEFFQSPYTQRILHPYIYRSEACLPPWLKLLCEIQYAKTRVPPARAPIDYCYVRPNHIAAVNALLQTLFWPGIDMSDCLSYPDYSIVALYKQLVVGCGFLVPDVGFNEAYISFMAVRPGWQRSGIATFMLYHLTQTCMTKDITLHVSATNPAVVLYQKFGFKVEEIILNFYEQYLPLQSTHSRHALFLRLAR